MKNSLPPSPLKFFKRHQEPKEPKVLHLRPLEEELALMALPYEGYSDHVMNGVVVHSIKGCFYFSCDHYTFSPFRGRVDHNAHAGCCFCDLPEGAIESWNPNPKTELMAGNPEHGYSYQDRHSSIGVFCQDYSRANPFKFFYLRDDIPRFGNNGGPFFSSIPRFQQTVICSSTHGLLLLRNRVTSTYYVINPFISQELQNSSWLQLPQPPIPQHRPQDPAILNFNEASRTYHVVCASKIIDGTADAYRFNAYYSLTGQWSTSHMTLENSGIIISSSITVSCGSMAYWMASTNTIGRILIRYNVDTGCLDYLPLTGAGEASTIISDSRMQLGRVGDNIGIVFVKEGKVELYLLESTPNNQMVWTPFGFLNVRMEGTNVHRLNRDWFIGMPYPVRFEGSRLQVLLWVGHCHFYLWESNSIQRNRTRAVPVQLPPDPDPLAWNLSVIDQGFPYVHSSYIPGTHRIIDTLDQEQLQEMVAHD